MPIFFKHSLHIMKKLINKFGYSIFKEEVDNLNQEQILVNSIKLTDMRIGIILKKYSLTFFSDCSIYFKKDYTFMMKCLNWAITHDDGADKLLYDIPQPKPIDS